jgi:hypothetical protein
LAKSRSNWSSKATCRSGGTLSEEAINAGHTVPRAVIWAVVGSGVPGILARIRELTAERG